MRYRVKYLSFRVPRVNYNLHFQVDNNDTLSSILSKMYILYKKAYEETHQERFPISRWNDEFSRNIIMDNGETFKNKRELEKACKLWLEDVWNGIAEDEAKFELVKGYSLMELKRILEKGKK